MVETALAMALARAGVVKSPADAIPLLEPRSERPAPPRLTGADVTWQADYTAAKAAAKSGEAGDNQTDEIDPSKLSMPELEAEVVARRDVISNIKDQLTDDEALVFRVAPTGEFAPAIRSIGSLVKFANSNWS